MAAHAANPSLAAVAAPMGDAVIAPSAVAVAGPMGDAVKAPSPAAVKNSTCNSDKEFVDPVIHEEIGEGEE